MKKRSSINDDLAGLVKKIGLALGLGISMVGVSQAQITPHLNADPSEDAPQKIEIKGGQFSPQPVSSDFLWSISKNYLEESSAQLYPSFEFPRQLPKNTLEEFKPYAIFGDENKYVVPAVFSLEGKGDNYELNTYLFSQADSFHVKPDAINLSINSKNEVNYSQMQKEYPLLLTEQVSTLYNIYFSKPYPVDEWRELVEIFDGSLMQHGVVATAWVVDAIASGVIGNFVYEKLKEKFSKKRDSVSTDRSELWNAISTDCENTGKLFLEIKGQQRGIHIEEIKGRTNIVDIEKIRAWLRLYGAQHCHAGEAACTYKFHEST